MPVFCPVCKAKFPTPQDCYLHAKAKHPAAVCQYLASTLFDANPLHGDVDVAADIRSFKFWCENCGKHETLPYIAEFCEKCGNRFELFEWTH